MSINYSHFTDVPNVSGGTYDEYFLVGETVRD
jgi:hypothetical protein